LPFIIYLIKFSTKVGYPHQKKITPESDLKE
jgi:hypothetical protein